MNVNEYRLKSRWRVRGGTVEEVFRMLADVLRYGRWWGSVFKSAEVAGPHARVRACGFLPYKLDWEGHLISAQAPWTFTMRVEGDFVGRGTWRLRQLGQDEVEVTFDWRVEVKKPLLRWLWPLRPLLVLNHRWAMKKGEEGINRELARLRGEAAVAAVAAATT